jgi:hypothetical protein
MRNGKRIVSLDLASMANHLLGMSFARFWLAVSDPETKHKNAKKSMKPANNSISN